MMPVNRIAAALDDDAALEKAIDEADEGFSRDFKDSLTSLAWKVFTGKATPDEEAQWKIEKDQIG
jgi:hypothetical protein